MGTKVLLVGCGFLGGVFLEEIVKRSKALEYHLDIHIIDPDTVSERNLANQNFYAQEIGMEKTYAMEYRYGETPWVSVTGAHEKIQDILHSGYTWNGLSLVVCAVDNQEARDHVWYYCVQHKIPLLMLGMSQQGQGQVEWVYPEIGLDCALSPMKKATRGKVDTNTDELPPCELTRWRGAGWNTAMCGARALFLFFGFDPEPSLNEEGPHFTIWQCDNVSANLIKVQEVSL